MKKVIIIGLVGILLIFCGIFLETNIQYSNMFIDSKTNLEGTVETTKKNKESYWDTKNAPVFYGATKITIKKGIIDQFDVLDTRFRVFAKDFEDGDLTHKITHSGTVDTNKAGTYSITYKVKDNHNNETTLTVPVIVTEDENAKINVERTLYTLPSVWNIALAGTHRCNSGDRQILGIYMPKESSIKVRALSTNGNMAITFITNDRQKEISQTLSNNGEWLTLQNKLNNGTYEAAVPYIKTAYLNKGDKDLTKTYKIELEYDTSVSELNYYHYKDNQEKYYQKWRESKAEYSVVENEVLTIVVPFHDIDRMVNHRFYGNGFTTLDQFFEYYKKAVDKMDNYIGLSLNPEKITDQNVRTRYIVRANIHGAGAAYYAGDHVGINSASVSSFFQMNWGGLHELAHGYQGNFGKGQMGLGETSNNILGHYIQIDKSIYFHPGDWLGNLKSIETGKNSVRESGKPYNENDVSTRLYMIVNLLDTFEGGTTYGKMFSWVREQVNSGNIASNYSANQDLYTLALADLYQVNIIPYMESWGLKITDSVKEDVISRNLPSITILKDMVSDQSLSKIMQEEKSELKYTPVKNDIYRKYNITGNATIKIDIDDINKLKGKNILIKDGKDIIKSVEINSNSIKLANLPAGSYQLQMPILNEYGQNSMSILVKENDTIAYTYQYKKLENMDSNNYLSFILKGYFDTYGYKLTFSDSYKKAKIEFGGAAYNGISEAAVKITDDKGKVISNEVKGYDNKGNLVNGGLYFNFNKGAYQVDLKPGYIIEITHSKFAQKVVWTNTLLNEEAKEYRPTATKTKYIVVENGVRMESMSEDEQQDISYQAFKKYATSIIDAYQKKVTDEELNNKFINFKEKSNIIYLYNNLRKEDQNTYQELIEKIKKGGTPTISTIGKLEYQVGEKFDLYSLIEAIDNEDGKINIDSKNTKIVSNINENMAGTYTVTYQVSDSDQNISTHQLQIRINGNNQNTPSIDDQPTVTPPVNDGGNQGSDQPIITPPSSDEDEGTNQPDVTPPSNDNENQEVDQPIITPPSSDENEETNQPSITPPTTTNKDLEAKDSLDHNKDLNSNQNDISIMEVEVPNTASDSSIYMYLLGFIILSFGVGIVFCYTKKQSNLS